MQKEKEAKERQKEEEEGWPKEGQKEEEDWQQKGFIQKEANVSILYPVSALL